MAPPASVRPRSSFRRLRRLALLPRHPQPRGAAGSTLIHRKLYAAHRLDAVLYALTAPVSFEPDASHVRLDLAIAVGANPAARPVAQGLRTVHRTGHAGRTEHALTAHAAVEQQALDRSLDARDGPLDALVSQDSKHAVQAHQQALEAAIESVQAACMAHRPAPDRVHQAGSEGGTSAASGCDYIDAFGANQSLQFLVRIACLEPRGLRRRLGLQIVAAGPRRAALPVRKIGIRAALAGAHRG